jgi:hypothetical protein
MSLGFEILILSNTLLHRIWYLMVLILHLEMLKLGKMLALSQCAVTLFIIILYQVVMDHLNI